MDKSKNRKIKKVPPLILPMGSPYKADREYCISKSQNYLMKIVPDCDLVGRDSGLKIWRAHNAKMIAKENLEKSLTEYNIKHLDVGEKWRKLSEKQQSFGEAFVKFNKFLCENEDKIKRTTQRHKINTEILQDKIGEIEEKRKRLREMSSVSVEMEERLDKHQIYENYLQSVLTHCGEFKSPMDIIYRYEELTSAKNELLAVQEEKISDLMSDVGDISQLVEDKRLEIIGMNNELAQLKIKHDSAKTESKKWEMIVNDIQNETVRRQSEFSRMVESLWLLYEKICKDKGIPRSCARNDYEGQLIVVMRGISEIKKIVEGAEERAEANMASDRAVASSF